jgi:signal transduction histidine kinase
MSRDARLESYRSLQEALTALRAELERTLETSAGAGALALRDRLHALETAAEGLHRTAENDFRHFGHELRTPLNALAGWGQILRNDPREPATVARAAEVVERNVAALAKTIEAYTG